MRTEISAAIRRTEGWGTWELNISHPSVNPEAITSVMNLVPDVAHKIGDPVVSKIGRASGSTHTWSRWIYRIPFDEGENAQSQFTDLVDRISQKSDELNELLGLEGERSVFARASNCECAMTMVSSGLLLALAQSNIEFGFEFLQGQVKSDASA
ncbi:MAG: DUF4279 domain-containing protein [Pseudomonadota bacterium]